MPSVDEFRSALQSLFREAGSPGAPYIEINSGQLHRKLGRYPGPRDYMPSCCQAMYDEEKAGDEVISRPPKGKGASLTIRYRLPRSAGPTSETPHRERPRTDVAAPQARSLSLSIGAIQLRATIAKRSRRRIWMAPSNRSCLKTK
jgi:hypothetical protein